MSCWKNFRISLNTTNSWVSKFFSMCGDLMCPLSSLSSPAPSFCTLDMQDGKSSVKSGAVCMHWPASKMSSRMLNSWVVPIWPQVWVLLVFSLGNLIKSEIKDQPSILYHFVKICKCILMMGKKEGWQIDKLHSNYSKKTILSTTNNKPPTTPNPQY